MSQSLFNSMLKREHLHNQATFVELGNSPIADYSSDASLNGSPPLSLIDLTGLGRVGFKGRDTSEWLTNQKVEQPNKPNQAIRLSDGSINARLSVSEFLFLNNFVNDALTLTNLNHWQLTDNKLCYKLERAHSHCWLLMIGEASTYVMSKICAIDFSDEQQFANLSIAQTSVARTNSIVIKEEINQELGYHILCDSTLAEFMWHSILDAMQEVNGQVAGISRLGS